MGQVSHLTVQQTHPCSKPGTSLAPGERLEPVHIHGVANTSLHVCLPKARGEGLTAHMMRKTIVAG